MGPFFLCEKLRLEEVNLGNEYSIIQAYQSSRKLHASLSQLC